MSLCIDIGNTHIVVGYFKNETLLYNWRLKSDRDITSDELAVKIFSLFANANLNKSEISKVVIASVVPALTRTLTHFSNKYLQIDPISITAKNIPNMNILLDQPSTVGADRIVNGYAAREIYGAPLIVVDFGTATTFDVINSRGDYEGGVIAPGMLLSIQALSSKTALLPNIEISSPENVIGKNTIDAMRSGVFTGYLCMTEGLLDRIEAEMSAKGEKIESIKVIGTGGLSTIISKESKKLNIIDKELTLKGLNLLCR